MALMTEDLGAAPPPSEFQDIDWGQDPPEGWEDSEEGFILPVKRVSLADSGQGLTVGVLREILRSFLLWRAVYESDGIEVIPLPDGSEVSIHDIEYLLLLTRELPVRHRQAIYLCLIYNKSEEDAAKALNLDGANPVAMYATVGLQEILAMVNLGLAPSRQKVYAKDAVLKNRAIMAEVEDHIDFGPGVYSYSYEVL